MKFFTLTAIFLGLSMSIDAQEAISISYDSTYRTIITHPETNIKRSHAKTTNYVTIAPDSNFPDRQISVKIDIPLSVDINAIKIMAFSCRTDYSSPYSKAIFLTKKQ